MRNETGLFIQCPRRGFLCSQKMRQSDWSSSLILEVLHLTPETQLTAWLELLLYSLYPLSLLEVNLHVPVAGRYFQCLFAAFLPALLDIAHSGRGSYINESDLLPHQYGFLDLLGYKLSSGISRTMRVPRYIDLRLLRDVEQR